MSADKKTLKAIIDATERAMQGVSDALDILAEAHEGLRQTRLAVGDHSNLSSSGTAVKFAMRALDTATECLDFNETQMRIQLARLDEPAAD